MLPTARDSSGADAGADGRKGVVGITADAITAATAALQQGDAARALDAARAGLADHDDPELLAVATEAAVHLGEDDATALARRLAAARPDDGPAQRWLGLALLADGESDAAEHALRAAVRLDPQDSAAVIALGHLVRRHGRDADAAEMLEQAAAADPEDTDLLRNLVDLHRMAGRSRKAVLWAERLVAALPDDEAALLDLAELQLALNEHDEARATFDRLRRADTEPGRAIYAWHGMIESDIRAGRLRAALDLAVSATAVDRNHVTTDVLAFVVAQVFGRGDRPAPTQEQLYAALAAERREYARLLAQGKVG